MKEHIRIGVDIGGTNIKIGLVNKKNDILATNVIKTMSERPLDEIVEDLVNGILYLMKEYNFAMSDCIGIGIGCPGTVDTNKGIVLYSNNIIMKNYPLCKILKRTFPIPIFLENDANCAAIGELVAGSAKNCTNMTFLTIGTGVGSCVIYNGKPIPFGGELGHLLYIHDGELCTCGRKGCYEAYASASALKRYTLEAAKAHKDSLINDLCEGKLENINAKTPFQAMNQGDEVAKKIVDDFIEALGSLITDIVNFISPDKIIIGGGVSAEGDKLTEALTQYVSTHAYGHEYIKIPAILPAKLGNRAGMIGAANLIH